MFEWLGNITINIIFAVIVILIAFAAASWLPTLVSKLIISAAETRLSTSLNQRRRTTLEGLSKHLTHILVGATCTIAVLALFVNTSGLLTFVGLFTAALGVSAGRLVNDYVSGIIFIFEDLFNVGEKVEIFNIEGTVLDVNLRTTVLRAPSGELYTIPNGDVRMVRNFGRGEFSLASVRVTVRTTHLDEAITLLETLTPTLTQKIPELIEQPTILSEDGVLSERIILTVFAKAQYGHGAEARRKLLLVVQDTFAQAKIDINTA